VCGAVVTLCVDAAVEWWCTGLATVTRVSRELNNVVVVGASLAGLRAVETLRQEGFDGAITVIGDEPRAPYDRPPLSKKVLAGEWGPERIQLRSPEVFAEIRADWRLGVTATGLDLDARTVALADGSSVAFDGLVIATGSRCRRLDDQPDGVHELRTVDDSLALRDAVAGGGRKVVVIGAGFIGLEVAATANGLGNEVTVLEGAEAPLIRGLGPKMGRTVGELHEFDGITIRCGVTVDSLTADVVTLGGGEEVAADVVVVGIGVTPNTDWLDGSGLSLDDGVRCDSSLRALATEVHVFAAGDVARWAHRLFDEEIRLEHWTNAAEQGATAAANLLAVAAGEEPSPYDAVPFVWSDQASHRIQFVGRSDADDDVALVGGSVEERTMLALYGRDGVLRGALGISAPRWVMPFRGPVAERMPWADALELAAELTH